MAEVFSNGMVAHVWAQQSQDHGRNGGGSFYFYGPAIYSYGPHFPIATFAQNAQGERAVFFTTRDYSPTTSQHKGEVLRAIPQGLPVFYVEIPAVPRNPADCLEADRVRRDYAERIERALGKAKRARTRTADHLETAERLAAEANRCANFFGWTWERFRPGGMDAEDFREWLDAERERERQARERREANERERMRQRAAQARADMPKWRAGEIDRPPYWAWHCSPALRIAGDIIETSHGATFPTAHARRAFRMLRVLKAHLDEQGAPVVRPRAEIRAGHFRVDAVEADAQAEGGAVVRAGCHRIEWAEVERIAAELGLSQRNGATNGAE